MNTDNTVDPVALAWCIPEIRESLRRAAAELDLHLVDEARSAEHLKKARTHVHQTQGALLMSNVTGVPVLTQEAESIIDRGARGEIALDGDAVGALQRALSAATEYLEDLQAGSTAPPLMLFTFYRALLLLRAAERVDPADLYFPDLGIQPPAQILSQGDSADGDDIGMLAASARREFERGLLGFLRGDDNVSSLRTMHAAMTRMQISNPVRHARTFFWVSLALLDALKHDALPVDLYTKRLVARVNIQARRTLESQDPVADRLLKDILFALARAKDLSPLITEVRRHFRLAGTVPADFEQLRYGLSDPVLVAAALEAVRALRKSWEKMVRGTPKEQEVFAVLAAGLAAGLRNLPYAGMSELADSLAAVSSGPASGTAPDDTLSLEVATSILFAEEALDGGLRADPSYDTCAARLGGRLRDLLDRSAAFSGETPPWLVEISRKASERSVLGALVTELKANLRGCEQALDRYFRDPAAALAVEGLMPLLAQARAVLATLGYVEAAKACVCLEADVQALSQNADQQAGDHPRIADNLSALGFFFDSLLQPGVQPGVFRFNELRRCFGPGEDGGASDRASGGAAPDPAVAGSGVDVAPHEVGSAESRIRAEREALVPWLNLLITVPQAPDVHDNLHRCLMALDRDLVLVDDVELKRKTAEALQLLGDVMGDSGPGGGVERSASAAASDARAGPGVLIVLLSQIAGIKAPEMVDHGRRQPTKASAPVADAASPPTLAPASTAAATTAAPNAAPIAAAPIAAAPIAAAPIAAAAAAAADRGIGAAGADAPGAAPGSADAGTASAAVTPASPSDEDDLELLQIFLLEADEVLAAIAGSLQLSRSAPSEDGHLIEMRRAFHTLKGSSRMVGLMQFSDAAWAFEQLLTQWLFDEKPGDVALYQVIEAGHQHFERWVARLHLDAATTMDSSLLIAECDALRKAAEPASVPGVGQVLIGSRSIDAGLFDIFNQEASGIRRSMGVGLSDWRKAVEPAAPEPLARALHTLIGMSRHVELPQVRGIAEPAEQFLLDHARSGRPLPVSDAALLEVAFASLDSMLDHFSRRIEPPHDAQSELAMTDLALRWSGPRVAAEPDRQERREGHHGQDGPSSPTDAGDPSDPVEAEGEPEADRPIALLDELDVDLGPVFFEETDHLLPQIDHGLRHWQANPGDVTVSGALMRLLHTIKGSARMSGAMRFGEVIHDMESRVEEAVSLPGVPEELVDELLAQYDLAFAFYEQMKDAAVQPQVAPHGSASASAAAPAMNPGFLRAATGASPDPFGPSVPAGLSGSAERDADRGAGVPQAAALSQQVIRVRADLLDRMVSEASEVSVARARLDSEVASIRQSLGELTENVNRLRGQLREIEIQADNQIQAKTAHGGDAHEGFDPLEFDRYTRFQELTKMLAESVNDVATVQQNALRSVESATQDLVRQGQVSRSLQQNLMQIRMVQFSTVSDRLYRVVRQAGKDANKRVVLELRGGNAEVDRSVLERMAGSMEHLLRNAVAHGIESGSGRIAAGKPEIGELVVDMRQEGNEVIMSFSDDGAGLNYARIEQRARERGLLPDGRQASEHELAQFIFTPGFSTAVEVTTLAGRGVGLDVVSADVSAMGGRIGIEATPGVGTRFVIHLPVSLAVSQVVLLTVGNARFAVQAALVERILQVKPDVLAAAYGTHSIACEGDVLPMHFLGSLLELPKSRPLAQRLSPVVIVRTGTSRIALHVDAVVPNQDVVIKNVGPQLARLNGIAGATVLGNGDIVLILNPVQLALSCSAGEAGAADSGRFDATVAAPPATVMVVDDSVTVRKVTQRLLVREGYLVLLAKDGVDALRQLQDVVPDMMLVDVEMPRMDGFDLTRNVRSTPRLQNIPIIMITSRTADKHRNHALSLGVDVFLGKPYAEDELLRHVRGFAMQRSPETVG